MAELGDLAGFPLLWFHGTPGGRLQIPPDAPEAAARRGLRLVSVERPGTGWSTPHRYAGVRDFAADVKRLADALRLDRFAVAGYSGGGPYALACAHDLRERVVAAVVVGGVAPVRGPDAVPGNERLLAHLHDLAERLADPLGRMLPAILGPAVPRAMWFVRAFTRFTSPADRALLLDPIVTGVLVGDLLHALDGGLGATFHDLRLLSEDWGFRLRDVRVPVHFFQGDADELIPMVHGRHQASLVQHGTLTLVPGGGHFAAFVDGARLFDAVLPFVLRERAAAAR